MARTVKPPTLAQWGCAHSWRVRHTRRWPNPWPAKHRNYRCERCGLGMVTEERPAVAWDERYLVALVKSLLPEGQPVYLRNQGITELPLYGLNAVLLRHGLVIHAAKVRNSKRFVACTDKDGRVEQYGLFELRQIHQDAPGRMNGRRRREEIAL